MGKRLHVSDHATFCKMLFEGMKLIMNEEKFTISIRKHIILKISRSVSMIEGLKKKDRNYWSVFIRSFMDYVIGNIENIPRYFMYLHSLELFLRNLTSRDILEIWARFRSLSRKLPTAEERMENNASKWVLFQQFRDKLHREAKKAAVSRNLSLDDAGLEDYDLRDSRNQSQNNSQSISRQLDAMGDININVDDDDDDDKKEEQNEEKKEENEQVENEENEEPNVV